MLCQEVGLLLSRCMWQLHIFLHLKFVLLILVNTAGVPANDKNWPPFFPIIHHDIANEIPAHAQRLQYLAFASWLGLELQTFRPFIWKPLIEICLPFAPDNINGCLSFSFSNSSH